MNSLIAVLKRDQAVGIGKASFFRLQQAIGTLDLMPGTVRLFKNNLFEYNPGVIRI